jgi:nuclear pore complex protein Nup88
LTFLGPLTILPAQKNNYGDDSCSLLVIPSTPTALVIAENSGILHHVLMVESNNEAGNDEKFDWDLYAVESIELELSLQNEKIKEESDIVLKRDPINDNRYFCYHDAGLHGVTIGFIQQLSKYTCDEESEEDFNASRFPSRAEYILSTRAFTESKSNAIVGFGLLQSPTGRFS